MWPRIKDDCEPESGAKMLDKPDYEPIEGDEHLRFRRVPEQEWRFASEAERLAKQKMHMLKQDNNSRPVSVYIFCTDMFTQERVSLT